MGPSQAPQGGADPTAPQAGDDAARPPGSGGSDPGAGEADRKGSTDAAWAALWFPGAPLADSAGSVTGTAPGASAVSAALPGAGIAVDGSGTAMAALVGAAATAPSSDAVASAEAQAVIQADTGSAMRLADAGTPATAAPPIDLPRWPLHDAAAAAPIGAPLDISTPAAPMHLAEQVAWALSEGLAEVRLQLHPADLGPLDVHLSLQGDRVNVQFHAPDAAVRDVVQTSLPNLSALLSAQGLQLDQANVFTQHGRTPGRPAERAEPAVSGTSEVTAPPPRRLRRGFGLLDDYV